MSIVLRYLVTYPHKENVINESYWKELLDDAEKLGWSPAGTVLLVDDLSLFHPEWDGSYTNPKGQRITPADGAELARFLRLQRDLLDVHYIDHSETLHYYSDVAEIVAKGNVSINKD